jgi:hypothetical protein
VLATLLLLGAVLVLDGAEKWGTFVSLVFVVHLPLALLEGVLVGMTVSFLTRVKPSLLGARPVELPPPPEPAPARDGSVVTAPPVLAILALLLMGGPASAHPLKANYAVDPVKRQVSVYVYFTKESVPQKGSVKVTAAGETIAEGPTDANGWFTFSYEHVEPLRVELFAEGAHSSHFVIEANELVGTPSRVGGVLGEIMAGVALVLALGALVMSWLNSRRLRRIEEKLNGANP